MIPKISVVTRAYNAEKYLKKCIESVLNQSFSEFEYFIIDNGSLDGTKQIIEDYAARDDRIKPIYLEENDVNFSAVKLLAQRGIGEFFMSLDSDDWLEIDFMKILYKGAKKNNADIAIGGTSFCTENEEIFGNRKSNNEYFIKREYVSKSFRLLHQFFRPVWGKLFSATLVKENLDTINEKRPPYLMYGGDTYTSLEFLRRANGVYLSQQVLHNYRVYASSVSYKYYKERFQSDVFLLLHAKEFLQDFGEISKENESFLFGVYFNAIKDTLKVLFGAKENGLVKLEQLAIIFEERMTKKLFYIYANEERAQVLKDVFESICSINNSYHKTEVFERCLRSIVNISELFTECELSSDIIMKYKDIFILAIESKWSEMKEKVIEVLAEDDLTIVEEEKILKILLKLSALTEDASVFLLGNKLLIRNFSKQGKSGEARAVLAELEEMNPLDDDIETLRKEIQ